LKKELENKNPQIPENGKTNRQDKRKKAVSGQLPPQLPQNSGARGKGNWSLSGPAPTLRRLSVQMALRRGQRQKLEIKIYKSIREESIQN
jgi:hypothetical protein